MAVDVLPVAERSATLRGGSRFWRGVSREPLLHFVLIGAALFALDQYFVSKEEYPLTIVLDSSVDDEARSVFRAARSREPDGQELAALRQIWLDNEVLYREGLALQVDRGDPTIRERVIFKALSLVNAEVKLPPADDATLRAWFEANRGRYDQPLRLDFEEALLPGVPDESEVRAFAAALNDGTRVDTGAGLRVFTGRPLASVIQSYGAAVAEDLTRASPGKWAPFRINDRWHALRLTGATAATPADYEQLRGPILQDWQEAVATEQRTAAVRTLTRKYRIVSEGRGD